jgi:hypothetical protein
VRRQATYCRFLQNDSVTLLIIYPLDYYDNYPVNREYYQTLNHTIRQDCDLILDGTRPTEELAQRIVAAISNR